jgi:hypothetical protein
MIILVKHSFPYWKTVFNQLSYTLVSGLFFKHSFAIKLNFKQGISLTGQQKQRKEKKEDKRP